MNEKSLDETVGIFDLRYHIRCMMEKRSWSFHWTERTAYLHLEASELAESVRNKRGDALKESADVLITLLALSPYDLDTISAEARRIVDHLMSAPIYEGEERTTPEES